MSGTSPQPQALGERENEDVLCHWGSWLLQQGGKDPSYPVCYTLLRFPKTGLLTTFGAALSGPCPLMAHPKASPSDLPGRSVQNTAEKGQTARSGLLLFYLQNWWVVLLHLHSSRSQTSWFQNAGRTGIQNNPPQMFLVNILTSQNHISPELPACQRPESRFPSPLLADTRWWGMRRWLLCEPHNAGEQGKRRRGVGPAGLDSKAIDENKTG